MKIDPNQERSNILWG